MPHVDFAFTTSTAVVFLLAVAAGAISWFVYRRTVPPVPRSRRILLIVLRSLSLFLLLTFLFEPVLRLVFTSEQPSTIALLLDDSQSMSMTDRAMNRKAVLHSLLASSPMKDVVQESSTRTFAFGAALKSLPATFPDSLRLNGDATNVSAALRGLAAEKEALNLRAILLVSDGAYNVGQNPVYEAEQMGVPIFAVGIGDSSEQKDVLITRVVANDLVYAGTQAPVDVALKSSGYGGENVEIMLMEGSRQLDRKIVTLGSGTREYSVRLAYTPEGEGLKKYTLRISSLPGELTAANNQKSFYAKILKSKLHVVILAGAPSPDLTTIRQTLLEEKKFEVRTFTQKTPGEFFEGQITATQLDSADCFVLIGYPTNTTDGAALTNLTNVILQQRKPFLMIASRTLDYGRIASWNSVLPFTPVTFSTAEADVFFQPAEAQRLNPILAMPLLEGVSAWNKLPPIYKSQSTFHAKPEAVVLGFPRMQGVLLNEPMMLTRNLNRQKSMAILGYGLWRWRLMTQGTPETEQLLGIFLGNSIQWLTTREDNKPVRIVTTKESFTRGEPVEFVGMVYDAAARPIDNAQVRVTAKTGEREFSAILRPIGNGRYEGSIDGLEEGEYAYRGTATSDNQSLGDDAGRFSVGELNLEFQDTRMNASLLRELAHRTGGRFYLPGDLSSLKNDLASSAALAPRESIHTSTFELWNWRYSLAVIVLLLGIEWFLRKRSGML
jgi:hypothetical protein